MKKIIITVEQLQTLEACQDGIHWFQEHKVSSLRPLVSALLKDDKASYARWLLPRLMTYPQQVKWAIYNAEAVLKIFEKEYPEDKRPRKAIQATKDFLKGKITLEELRAASAAACAASGASGAARAACATSGASGAAWAASGASGAARAAWAAGWASGAAWATSGASGAAWAASGASWAESAASEASGAAEKKLNKKLFEYALKLLGV